MGSRNSLNQNIAECVGLWLAEGDNKTTREITFTNSQPELIDLFDSTLRSYFNNGSNRIRLYVYSKRGKGVKVPISDCNVKNYIDKRATRPYFIWRLGSIHLNKVWRGEVKDAIGSASFQSAVLRGFFAGEGNIKIGSHGSRTLRIAQGERIPEIENILEKIGVTFKFRKKERNYYITHKENWEKLAKLRIADLHPLKKDKFWKAYNSFKEDHYRAGYLKKEILNVLDKPFLPAEGESKFQRSKARIQEVLMQLKKEGLIENFRVGSKDYWVRKDRGIIIISWLKRQYLNLLEGSPRRTYEFARCFKVDFKSSHRRLKELEKLGLVKRNVNKGWFKVKVDKEVITIWP